MILFLCTYIKLRGFCYELLYLVLNTQVSVVPLYCGFKRKALLFLPLCTDPICLLTRKPNVQLPWATLVNTARQCETQWFRSRIHHTQSPSLLLFTLAKLFSFSLIFGKCKIGSLLEDLSVAGGQGRWALESMWQSDVLDYKWATSSEIKTPRHTFIPSSIE